MSFRFHFYSRSDAKEMADCIYRALKENPEGIPYIISELLDGDYMNGSMNFYFKFEDDVQEPF